MYFLLTCGLFLPFFGTLLGAAFIFFMKSSLHPLAEQVMLGFAAGVMTAASIWSLLLPSMEQASNLGVFSFVPAAAGFLETLPRRRTGAEKHDDTGGDHPQHP